MLYENLFKKLAKERIKYIVVGGIAVNLHGYSRFTSDLDVLISLEEKQIIKFVSVVKKMGYKPRLPVKLEDLADAEIRRSWVEDKNMMVFSIYQPKKPIDHIDIMIDSPIKFDTLYKNRVRVRTPNVSIPIASLNDIIKMKKDTGRLQDQLDIEKLKLIRKIKNEKARK